MGAAKKRSTGQAARTRLNKHVHLVARLSAVRFIFHLYTGGFLVNWITYVAGLNRLLHDVFTGSRYIMLRTFLS